MTRRQALRFVFGLLFMGCIGPLAGAQKPNYNSYVGRRPPEITADLSHWLGWNETVALADLEGKVVWVQFNF